MIPPCDHTGTPLHFHSSITSGSACLMRARTRESVLPLQSSSSLILASISREGDSPLDVALFFILPTNFQFVGDLLDARHAADRFLDHLLLKKRPYRAAKRHAA